MARLVILSGPSCVGKSPLLKALQRFQPELAQNLQQLVLFNDRKPRPGEIDGVAYHFRPRNVIEELKGEPDHLVLPVRNDLQALDIAQVRQILASGRDPLFEGNVYMAEQLLQAPQLADLPKVSCFISPLSMEEVRYLQTQPNADLPGLVVDVMRRKLLRRTQRQKGIVGLPDLQDIEARCGAAFKELQYASHFDWVLANHDGEGSENWDAFYYPLGDARKCLLDFAAVLAGQEPQWAEKWPENLL